MVQAPYQNVPQAGYQYAQLNYRPQLVYQQPQQQPLIYQPPQQQVLQQQWQQQGQGLSNACHRCDGTLNYILGHHFRRDCKGEVFCTVCQKSGHVARTCFQNGYSRGRSTERGNGPPSRDPSTGSNHSVGNFQQPLGQANAVQQIEGGGTGRLDSFSSDNQMYYSAEGEVVPQHQQQTNVPW